MLHTSPPRRKLLRSYFLYAAIPCLCIVHFSCLFISVSVLEAVRNNARVSHPYYVPPQRQQHPYVVKVLTIPQRREQAFRNLGSLFPTLDMIEGIHRSDIDLDALTAQQQIIMLNTKWDNATGQRMLHTYNIPSYPSQGQVGCLLGHRRILERFVQEQEDQSSNADDDVEVALLVLEDDAVPNYDGSDTISATEITILQQIDDVLRVLPDEWEYVQLGRCWDINCRNRTSLPLVRVGDISIYESRGYELCSHAYLITLSGARKVLDYSLPILLPYDHLQMLLIRSGILKGYFTSPRLFLQSEAFASAIVDSSPGARTCDHTRVNHMRAIHKGLQRYDPIVLDMMRASSFEKT